MTKPYDNPRIKLKERADAKQGVVHWSKEKSLWFTTMLVVFLVAAPLTVSVGSVLIFIVFTSFILCFGHSLGMHRLFIHQSYSCPKVLEYFLVHLGVLVGLAGPFGMLRTHDLRDWAQRQNKCHDYFGHQQHIVIDGVWQILCDLKLSHPPIVNIESKYMNDPVYQWMEKYWMFQQLPWAIIFFILGGLPWVVWGICGRVVVSILGHWLVGFFAHNKGSQHYHIKGAAIQGYNISGLSLLTMGECWHNNHHAFPSSAKFGLYETEWDPGWWILKGMKKLGLVDDLKVPSTLPKRSDLFHIH